ncbi:hypothetical protein DYB36_001077 [Aphanomyces astaci]|nr:hypothetical protein DYB36_001077 [Aphanomyces astaci]
MGVNGGSKQIDLEQFGYNLANFNIPDERGWVAKNETITANEAASLETTLPLEKFLAHCTEQGCKVALSNDPGRYICNFTYFLSLAQTKARPNHHIMVKLIVTGFGKFGPVLINPTTKLATQLKDDPIVHTSFVLEVSAQGVRAALEPLWAEAKDDDETTVFVHLGVHDGTKTILLEQVGYNIANFRMPDEQGWVAQNEVIVADQPDSIRTHLPLETYHAALKAEGLQVELSTDPEDEQLHSIKTLLGLLSTLDDANTPVAAHP